MDLKIPNNLDKEMLDKFNELREILRSTEKTCRSKIISPTGAVVWEESEEDYKARMNELFYEVK